MLNFFRKYQKIFFLFVTIIIVTTFVFFGTYQAFGPTPGSKEGAKEAFDTLDKKSVTCAYMQDLTNFLGLATFSLKGGNNFLSDSFITQDILETGLYAPIVAKTFNEKMQGELVQRLTKEKHFKAYSNPYIPMLNVENVWALFAPDLKEKLTLLQNSQDHLEGFKARVELFLAERRFPAELLSYILQHQAKDYPDLPHDRNLQAEMLSLFNYRTLTDWFGPTFVEEVAKTVVQGAAFARQLGHKVTREEVVADLAFRREKAFKQNPALKERFANSALYYQECLKMLALDEERAIHLATDLLLFRRLFDGVGNIPVADSYGLQRFYQKANTYVEVELYQLPKEYLLQNEEDLKKLEVYYQLIAAQREDLLAIPKEDSIERIEERAPELILTSFEVDMSEISLKEAAAKVSVKETLAWQADPKNGKVLKEKFPQLEKQEVNLQKREERALIDSFAREEVAKSHPEWIEAGLGAKMAKSKRLVFGAKEESLPGISDPEALKELLERGEPLKNYTQDSENFYSITLKTKAPEKSLLTYPQAVAKGILEELVDRLDKSSYQQVAELVGSEMNRRWEYLLNQSKERGDAPLVEKREERIYSEGGVLSFEEALGVEEGKLSPICISPELGAYYFKSLGKKVDATLPLEQLLKEQKITSNELKQQLLNQLLQRY